MSFLGSSWTVTGAHGMFRIDVKDADALGLEPPASAASEAGGEAAPFSEKLVWDQMLNDAFRKLRDGLDDSQRAKLIDMQRSWIAHVPSSTSSVD